MRPADLQERLEEPHAFGRVHRVDPQDAEYPLERALPTRRQMRTTAVPMQKTWYLSRAEQIDQGNTPYCVGVTEEHWERSLPIHLRVGLGYKEMYRRAKLIDGYPEEEGTDARSMLKVCQDLGIVTNYFWYTGDLEQASLWLLLKGPMWLGGSWTESMLETGPDGKMDVSGKFEYGHETMLVSRDRKKKRWGIVNSWGLDTFGNRGRGFMSDDDMQRLLEADGDLVGVTQQKTAAR